jgi:hypothetical protein
MPPMRIAGKTRETVGGMDVIQTGNSSQRAHTMQCRQHKERKMTSKKMMRGMAVLVLTFGIMAAGCASAPRDVLVAQESPVALGLTLDELLHKYAVVPLQNTDDKVSYRYYLDPLRFEEFKAELDAGGEYTQTYSGPENRDKERGMSLARWVVRPSGTFQLELFTEDDSGFMYDYKKAPHASGLKLDELLRKYAGPYPQRWDGESKGVTYVYYLDPLHFEAFKAELDAGGAYTQTESWTNKNRDWDRGKTFARWAVRPDGSFQLDLNKEDNSETGYRYTKVRK